MLPEKLHIEQIQRFYKVLSSVDKQIDAENDLDKKLELHRKYYALTNLWKKIDDFTEFTLKHELDCMHLDESKS